MQAVRIVSAASAHPQGRVSQEEAARHVGVLSGDPRRARAIARGTHIATRAVVLPPEELARLGDIEERNRIYHAYAPELAARAALRAFGSNPRERIGCLATSSCTGYTVPGWGSQMVDCLGLGCDTVRLPITESGCAGGVVALTHAANFVRAHPASSALAVASEVCSLSFHAGGNEGNVTSTLIFGDGAGACLLEPGDGPGLRIIDSASMLIPGTRQLLGFDLTRQGFYPVLERELVDVLPTAVQNAAARLLGRNGIAPAEVQAWLLHPGGARILSCIEAGLGISRESTRWSWDSMRDFGNTSSAAVFEWLRRYPDEPGPGSPPVIAAFGPGVSIQLLLVARQC